VGRGVGRGVSAAPTDRRRTAFTPRALPARPPLLPAQRLLPFIIPPHRHIGQVAQHVNVLPPPPPHPMSTLGADRPCPPKKGPHRHVGQVAQHVNVLLVHHVPRGIAAQEHDLPEVGDALGGLCCKGAGRERGSDRIGTGQQAPAQARGWRRRRDRVAAPCRAAPPRRPRARARRTRRVDALGQLHRLLAGHHLRALVVQRGWGEGGSGEERRAGVRMPHSAGRRAAGSGGNGSRPRRRPMRRARPHTSKRLPQPPPRPPPTVELLVLGLQRGALLLILLLELVVLREARVEGGRERWREAMRMHGTDGNAPCSMRRAAYGVRHAAPRHAAAGGPHLLLQLAERLDGGLGAGRQLVHELLRLERQLLHVGLARGGRRGRGRGGVGAQTAGGVGGQAAAAKRRQRARQRRRRPAGARGRPRPAGPLQAGPARLPPRANSGEAARAAGPGDRRCGAAARARGRPGASHLELLHRGVGRATACLGAIWRENAKGGGARALRAWRGGE
jgi:hypothetical protein